MHTAAHDRCSMICKHRAFGILAVAASTPDDGSFVFRSCKDRGRRMKSDISNFFLVSFQGIDNLLGREIVNNGISIGASSDCNVLKYERLRTGSVFCLRKKELLCSAARGPGRERQVWMHCGVGESLWRQSFPHLQRPLPQLQRLSPSSGGIWRGPWLWK